MSKKKTRKFSVAPATPPNSEINVTPLVDVVLVLLIIFMVVTPLLEKDIMVRVPDVEEETDPQPPDPNNTQLVVSLNPAGELSINNEKVSDADFVENLKRKVAAKPAGEKLVFFMADDKTNYAKLITALDGARKAGAQILGMMTEPIAGSSAPADAIPVTPAGGAPGAK